MAEMWGKRATADWQKPCPPILTPAPTVARREGMGWRRLLAKRSCRRWKTPQSQCWTGADAHSAGSGVHWGCNLGPEPASRLLAEHHEDTWPSCGLHPGNDPPVHALYTSGKAAHHLYARKISLIRVHLVGRALWIETAEGNSAEPQGGSAKGMFAWSWVGFMGIPQVR